jgi:hypothetical protein
MVQTIGIKRTNKMPELRTKSKKNQIKQKNKPRNGYNSRKIKNILKS